MKFAFCSHKIESAFEKSTKQRKRPPTHMSEAISCTKATLKDFWVVNISLIFIDKLLSILTDDEDKVSENFEFNYLTLVVCKRIN